ncbi:hypothetical protein CC1G_03046 [Coprinopsis cinerea okayama7|uniref:Uncharacterized protein n=1 Tax=Coprinopsis cinerea (strain Okayama-7 / 130 / ATCC MYA-4618 / FGSC 9003) TaxID=240176 RepID=A8PEP9_COPC7|nr:hypothetical protein CC1G_03046 [Coprinopsis cinerea okayama7\|eukprot:XP_001840817.1 hypothetical protein CC1G_03046 [Coprinopsis cinerea okayama7\
MKAISLAAVLAFALSASAAINDPCSVNGTPGICLTTTSCTNQGGQHAVGFCPKDPANVRCCTKKCGQGGTCRFENTCRTGLTAVGLCPGPANFKCCFPKVDRCGDRTGGTGC